MPVLARLIVCLSLMLPVLSPPAAAAHSQLVDDERRKVVRLTFNHECRGRLACHDRRTVDTRNRVGDVVFSRSTYARRALYLKVKVRRITTRRSIATYISGDAQNSAWYDVAGLGSDLKLTYEVAEKNFGREIYRGPAPETARAERH